MQLLGILPQGFGVVTGCAVLQVEWELSWDAIEKEGGRFTGATKYTTMDVGLKLGRVETRGAMLMPMLMMMMTLLSLIAANSHELS